MHHSSSDSDDGYIYDEHGQHPRPQSRRVFSGPGDGFGGRRRREEQLERSQSLESFFQFTGDFPQVKKKNAEKALRGVGCKRRVQLQGCRGFYV